MPVSSHSVWIQRSSETKHGKTGLDLPGPEVFVLSGSRGGGGGLGGSQAPSLDRVGQRGLPGEALGSRCFASLHQKAQRAEPEE